MPLTDVQIRKAKPAEKPFKLNDGGGLHLYVSVAGGKSWRYRYEIGGREKLLTIGSYPDVGLADAREARQAAKAKVFSPGIWWIGSRLNRSGSDVQHLQMCS